MHPLSEFCTTCRAHANTIRILKRKQLCSNNQDEIRLDSKPLRIILSKIAQNLGNTLIKHMRKEFMLKEIRVYIACGINLKNAILSQIHLIEGIKHYEQDINMKTSTLKLDSPKDQ